jgi:glutamate-ammonia-ligase adenylyltransferase
VGLVEVEFIAQGLQLIHAHAQPEVLATNTFTALSNLHQAGLLSAADHETLQRAGTLYHTLTHVLRLCTTGRFSPGDAPPGFMSLMLRAAAAPDIAALEHMLLSANTEVAAVFDRLVGAP